MFTTVRTYLDVAAGLAPNPSSAHEEGRRARARLAGARATIARLLEVKADDLIFTSGATEANALAIIGLAKGLKKSGRAPIRFLYLPSAHASVVENMKAVEEWGIEVRPLPLAGARVDIEALSRMLTPETALVSMDAVCGETGVIWNTREVRQALEQAGHGTLLHVDASQAPLTEKILRAHFGADLMTLDISKVSVARGAGVLAAHRTIPLAPLYEGGGQERGLRPGSEPVELIETFAKALGEADARRERFRAEAARERAALVRAITASVRGVSIEGGGEGRQAPHILSLALPGRDTDYLAALLNEAGFAVSTRSACESGTDTPSRAVLALTNDRQKAEATLRISWGPLTSLRRLRRFPQALAEAVAFVDRGSAG